MDLHNGNLFWPITLPNRPTYSPLQDDIQCDVLIIGGGSGGALMAFELLRNGIDTVLIEKRTISGGTSLTSSGLLQYASDKHLTTCIHSFGEECIITNKRPSHGRTLVCYLMKSFLTRDSSRELENFG